jgi:agmatine deiminase
MPPETHRHERTLMAWPHRPAIYGGRSTLDAVRADVIAIAHAIARFEPVLMVVHPDDVADARDGLGRAVDVLELAVDDLWLRDSGPLFGFDHAGRPAARGLNFNGWGGRQAHLHDGTLAARLAAALGVPFAAAGLVAEGGGIEFDGAGTLLVCESSVVNDNRNPGRARDDIEQTLRADLGATRVIWLTGLRDHDITDYHVDATARFVDPATILVQLPAAGAVGIWAEAARRTYGELVAARRPDGEPYALRVVDDPVAIRADAEEFLSSYANYALVNGGVIAPSFGDRDADEAAAAVLADLHPGRSVVQVEIDALGAFGGGIHCATQQQPAAAG